MSTKLLHFQVNFSKIRNKRIPYTFLIAINYLVIVSYYNCYTWQFISINYIDNLHFTFRMKREKMLEFIARTELVCPIWFSMWFCCLDLVSIRVCHNMDFGFIYYKKTAFINSSDCLDRCFFFFLKKTLVFTSTLFRLISSLHVFSFWFFSHYLDLHFGQFNCLQFFGCILRSF